jgi:hypothetical protein
MAKIIRISIAGIQSTGKSYLIGGIKSVFNGSGIMDNLGYKYLPTFQPVSNSSGMYNSYFVPLKQIEQDIENAASGKGTDEWMPYLGEIVDSSKKTQLYLMIANISGEMYRIYYNQTSEFIGYLTAFETLLSVNYKARKLLTRIEKISVKPNWMTWYKKDNLSNLSNNEVKLWLIFSDFIKEQYPEIYKTQVNQTGNRIEPNFSAFIFSYLANQTYLCFDPNPKDDKKDEQNRLLTAFCDNIISRNKKPKDISFVFTKFDSLFKNPNKDYLPNVMASQKDYFNNCDKYLQMLSSLPNLVDNPSGINIDPLSTFYTRLRNSGKLQFATIDNIDYPKNLFLTCTININNNKERIPDPEKIDYSSFPMDRFPIGCYELVYSMLLKNENIKISQLNLDSFNNENYKFLNTYLN